MAIINSTSQLQPTQTKQPYTWTNLSREPITTCPLCLLGKFPNACEHRTGHPRGGAVAAAYRRSRFKERSPWWHSCIPKDQALMSCHRSSHLTRGWFHFRKYRRVMAPPMQVVTPFIYMAHLSWHFWQGHRGNFSAAELSPNTRK